MEQLNFNIQDGSNDRMYFTVIPNYVLDHANHWDREVYNQMKRVAGEKGICWTSRKELAKKCGFSLDRIKKSIKSLLDNGWIKFIGTRQVMTKGGAQNCNQYKIADIWSLNNHYYQDKFKGGSPENLPIAKRGVVEMAKGGRGNGKGGSPNDYKEEPMKKITEEEHPFLPFKRKTKRYYNGLEMRQAQGKWWCMPKGGGDWLEFDMRFFKDTVEK